MLLLKRMNIGFSAQKVGVIFNLWPDQCIFFQKLNIFIRIILDKK